MGMVICKFYGSSFRSHPCPAIFSCTKQFVFLLDIENWCVLSYYFNVLSQLWSHWFVVQTVLPFTARCYSPCYLPIAANESEVSPIGLLPCWRKRWIEHFLWTWPATSIAFLTCFFQLKLFLRKKWKQAGSLEIVSENNYSDWLGSSSISQVKSPLFI